MSESTFQEYTAEQAQTYAIQRGSTYPAPLYEEILRYHGSTGGRWQRFVDVGCGPGKSTHDLARFFDVAIGIDHSSEMIKYATRQNFEAKKGPVKYYTCDAETFDKLPTMEPNSIDLITAGMAVRSLKLHVVLAYMYRLTGLT
jgi:trans-aconitate 3-methyltransferase